MAEGFQPSNVIVSPPPAQPEKQIPAPMWHTALLVLILLGLSALSYFTSIKFVAVRPTSAVPSTLSMIVSYAATMVEEWLLFFFVLWGERIRVRVPIRERIGIHTEKDAVWRDIGIAALVWFTLLVIGGVFGFLLHRSPNKVVAELLPHTLLELGIWAPLAVSAGFCEEYIFRGYLQRQFSLLTGSIWAGVLIQAAIFGLAHGYQGFASMAMIFCFGIVFGAVATMRKSLRPGMFAHGWLDFFSGFAGYIAHIFRLL